MSRGQDEERGPPFLPRCCPVRTLVQLHCGYGRIFFCNWWDLICVYWGIIANGPSACLPNTNVTTREGQSPGKDFLDFPVNSCYGVLDKSLWSRMSQTWRRLSLHPLEHRAQICSVWNCHDSIFLRWTTGFRLDYSWVQHWSPIQWVMQCNAAVSCYPVSLRGTSVIYASALAPKTHQPNCVCPSFRCAQHIIFGKKREKRKNRTECGGHISAAHKRSKLLHL